MTFSVSLEDVVRGNRNELLSVHRKWARVRLGDVVEILNGYPFPSEKFSNESGTPLLRIRDVIRGRTETYFNGKFDPSYVVNSGELIVGMDGDFNCARWRGEPALLNQRVCKLTPNPEFFEPSFLDKVLPGYLSAIHAATSSMTVKHLSSRTISDIPLPLPSRNEQRRLAEKLDELFSDLDAGVSALERARANLNRYRAAVLKAAVEGRLTEKWRAAHPDVEPASKLLERILAERRKKWEAAQLKKYADKGQVPPKGWKDKYPEPVGPEVAGLPALPKEWCWATVDQLSTEVRNGSARAPTKEATRYRILRINAVRSMSVDLNETRRVDLTALEAEEARIRDGDLLFTRYNGSPELVGVAGLVRGLEGEILHPDKLIRVRVLLGDLLQEYLELVCNVGASRDHIRKRTRTTAGQAGVSGADIKQTPIPLPPAVEVGEIVREASRSLSLISASEEEIGAGLGRAPRLRQSILKSAFEGKLVPQDPRDEPASELLARIQLARSDQTAGGGKIRKKIRQNSRQKSV